jgi:hypothetical protein
MKVADSTLWTGEMACRLIKQCSKVENTEPFRCGQRDDVMRGGVRYIRRDSGRKSVWFSCTRVVSYEVSAPASREERYRSAVYDTTPPYLHIPCLTCAVQYRPEYVDRNPASPLMS